MKVIPLSQGLFAKVDDADYERVINFGRWCAVRASHTCYAVCTKWGRHGKKLYLHCFLMGRKGIDHIDGDGLNNQRQNLRVATQSQQSANAGLSKSNSSGYKGVSWFKRDRCWMVGIKIGGKRKHLGYFEDIKQAAAAYDEAAKQAFGEFACTNEMMRSFPRGTLKPAPPSFFAQFDS